MKKNILWTMAIALGVLATACVEDDNPGIEEHPWNYTINPVKLNYKVPTGILLYNAANDMWANNNDGPAKMRRLEEPYDATTGKYGPNVKISMGEYLIMGGDRSYDNEYAVNLGQIVETIKKAKIDYIITPQISEDRNKMFPNNISGNDTVFINMLSGHTDTLDWQNDGSMKFAIRINVRNVANDLGCNSNTELLEKCSPREYRLDNGQTYQKEAREVFLDFFRRISWFFMESTYYHFNGRPVLVMDGADEVWTSDPAALYADIRAAIKEQTNKDVYLIARQEEWTPPARYHYFWIQGGVDAVCPERLTNLKDGIGWDRFDMYNLLINEHMKVNREHYANYGINYVPSVSPGFSYYIQDARWDYPIIQPDPEDFRTRCWVAKMQLGSQPMVIVDAYNEWNFGNAVEPTDLDYGNGWGDAFLNVIAEEFGN